MKGQTYVFLAILFIIVVAVFAVANTDVVEVNYIFWAGDAPLIFVILFSVLMGVIITSAVGIVRIFRLQRDIRRLKKENSELIELQKESNSKNRTDFHKKRPGDSSETGRSDNPE